MSLLQIDDIEDTESVIELFDQALPQGTVKYKMYTGIWGENRIFGRKNLGEGGIFGGKKSTLKKYASYV